MEGKRMLPHLATPWKSRRPEHIYLQKFVAGAVRGERSFSRCVVGRAFQVRYRGGERIGKAGMKSWPALRGKEGSVEGAG